MTDKPFRLLPRLGGSADHTWTGGADGELRFLRCQGCGYWLHPPGPICPECWSKDLAPEATSGRGTVWTFSINHQPWYPGLDPPYAVAVVELEDQAGLRWTTNLVDVAVDDVHIGLPVEVTFEQYDDVWLPFFRPVGA